MENEFKTKNNNSRSGSCAGNRQSGTFLMSPYASNKEQPNNRRFSSCSEGSINRIFTNMKSGRKSNCFKVLKGKRGTILNGVLPRGGRGLSSLGKLASRAEPGFIGYELYLTSFFSIILSIFFFSKSLMKQYSYTKKTKFERETA